jgi:hypothetical protein
LAVCWAAAPAWRYSEVPNARLTPGEVRAGDLGSILATEAETEAGRPGAAEKRAAWGEYGYPGKSDGQHWEYDHLVPIECGGDNDLKNIWPEPRVGCKIRSNPITDSDSIRSLIPVKPITDSDQSDHRFR